MDGARRAARVHAGPQPGRVCGGLPGRRVRAAACPAHRGGARPPAAVAAAGRHDLGAPGRGRAAIAAGCGLRPGCRQRRTPVRAVRPAGRHRGGRRGAARARHHRPPAAHCRGLALGHDRAPAGAAGAGGGQRAPACAAPGLHLQRDRQAHHGRAGHEPRLLGPPPAPYRALCGRAGRACARAGPRAAGGGPRPGPCRPGPPACARRHGGRHLAQPGPSPADRTQRATAGAGRSRTVVRGRGHRLDCLPGRAARPARAAADLCLPAPLLLGAGGGAGWRCTESGRHGRSLGDRGSVLRSRLAAQSLAVGGRHRRSRSRSPGGPGVWRRQCHGRGPGARIARAGHRCGLRGSGRRPRLPGPGPACRAPRRAPRLRGLARCGAGAVRPRGRHLPPVGHGCGRPCAAGARLSQRAGPGAGAGGPCARRWRPAHTAAAAGGRRRFGRCDRSGSAEPRDGRRLSAVQGDRAGMPVHRLPFRRCGAGGFARNAGPAGAPAAGRSPRAAWAARGRHGHRPARCPPLAQDL